MGCTVFNSTRILICRATPRIEAANVVFQIWEEFFHASHSAFVHVDMEITDMKSKVKPLKARGNFWKRI